jgi:outer membrane protein OmpA-like peptidoglycan-associated protein
VAPQPGQPAPAGGRPQAAPAQPAPGQTAPAPSATEQAPAGRRDGQVGDRDGQNGNRDGQIGNRDGLNGNRDGQIGNRDGLNGNRDGRIGQDQVQGQPQERRRGLDPGAAAALGAAAGFAGGFVASQGVRGIDDVRQRREEFTDNGVTVIREPGRTIVQENGRSYLRHDETERFRDLGGDVRMERRGAEQVTVYQRGDGSEIVTVTDETGRLIRRTRRARDGEEVVIIDNGWDRRPARLEEEVVDLPPPRLRIPRERYIVNAEGADEETIYETLTAPEVDPVPQRYTLDQVRYSPDVRARMRSVDVDTITFETGSWEVDPGQAPRLRVLADAVRRAVDRNPREVFLVEGHTDAVGSDVDNLSLSDRRAQSVAAVLTRDFGVPPENLTTQGYGEQYPKVQTDGPSRENRRVTIRRITPLLNGPKTSQQ